MGLEGSLLEAGQALRRGEVTSVELTERALAVADEFGVYLARFPDHALASARRADRDFAAGVDRGPVQGIPLGVKDLIAVAEGPTTAQSVVLDWGTGVDAAVTRRLKAAGGVIVGKTSTMEFGCGVPDGTKPFPIPRNPRDTERWAGGSSSGTASGVAAGMFFAGLGSDTAGSIRMPAAFCGVTGLMPTHGRVSGAGCVPLASSLDRVGPLARTVRDCAALLEVIAEVPFVAPEFTGDLTGLRIGVVREHHFPEGADPALAGVFDEALSALEGLGAELVEVALPHWSELTTAVLVTASCEALAQHRSELITRWHDYGVSTRAIFAAGSLISGADYVQAQRVRQVARRELTRLLEDVDVIASPVASIGAPLLTVVADEAGQQNADVFGKINTPYWNGVGNPVLAVPMGETADGLPLSLQLAGDLFDEATVLRVGEAFQRQEVR
ncbi:aspartyl-tRNA(Asn)/glutamyl-tRNA(Gln) amidotransferase subunit A [Amycolatopsis umgeniensis]|uniref:Aspartyl-tRNA(Asn)/glutamyl-tRNA(Gln) amidotransferase subunit A n=1 Tax=Amycolatopsis umgeniensis TaxID=336628 RepID=A0A841B1Z1_9PSEU|nr:aspartyl-tRNA(Asn)/glutamyl-tRNA(Gln) amidotransferase subunit A [Amycolatopsis umgeniensis]